LSYSTTLDPEPARVAANVRWRRVKSESIMGVTPTPLKTKEAAELSTLEWVSWFMDHRLLEPIGHVPPAKCAANCHRQLAESAVSA